MSSVKRNKQAHKSHPVKHKKLFKRIHNPVTLKKLAIAFAITLIAVFAYVKVYPHTFEAKQTRKLQATVQQLKQLKADQLKQQTQSQQQDQEKAKKIDDLNKQLEDAQKQLEAKRAAATVYAAEQSYTPPAPVVVAPVAPVASIVSGCGDNTYSQYIYSHESSCNLTAVNSIGCRGIGQACPGGKLPCGADYECQNAFFTNYALTRYGSWAAAYNFWVTHRWW